MQNIHDTVNFVKYFIASPAASSTAHLYISALATWPKQSFISQTWIKYFPFIPSLTHVRGNIMTPLMAIPTKDWIYAVAFSHDGTRIVAGSLDKSVQVWDALTGAELHQLNGHTNRVNSVAFSHDSTHIVSG